MHVNYTVVIQFYTASTQTNFEDMDHDGQADGDSHRSQATGGGCVQATGGGDGQGGIVGHRSQATGGGGCGQVTGGGDGQGGVGGHRSQATGGGGCGQATGGGNSQGGIVGHRSQATGGGGCGQVTGGGFSKAGEAEWGGSKMYGFYNPPPAPRGPNSWRVRKDTKELESSQADTGDIGRLPAEGRKKSEEGNLDWLHTKWILI